ncbi:MAG TPA: VOC family protein [Actinomycetes bacterium]|jgi:hypothetical protein|nr:VOC family protein [Actinomycetes bacterium]
MGSRPTEREPPELNLRPIDGSHEAEVERLLALGARPADVGQGQVPWMLLADPEGNEFCVLGSLAAPNLARVARLRVGVTGLEPVTSSL